MNRYWILVASKEHVLRGIYEGICQVCHGKVGPLKKMKPGDWIIYYSPVEIFGKKTPCRQFTAIGQLNEGEPYQFHMSDDFVPWRRDVTFYTAKPVAIEPLLAKLSFTANKRYWGLPFRTGCFEINKDDFEMIASCMELDGHEETI